MKHSRPNLEAGVSIASKKLQETRTICGKSKGKLDGGGGGKTGKGGNEVGNFFG